MIRKFFHRFLLIIMLALHIDSRKVLLPVCKASIYIFQKSNLYCQKRVISKDTLPYKSRSRRSLLWFSLTQTREKHWFQWIMYVRWIIIYRDKLYLLCTSYIAVWWTMGRTCKGEIYNSSLIFDMSVSFILFSYFIMILD